MIGLDRRWPLRPFLFAVVIGLSFVELVSSAPSRERRETPPSSCTNEVIPARSRLTYEVGKTYTYEFGSEIVTQIIGGSDEDSRLKFTGQAELAVLSSCEYVLTVLKFSLDNPNQQAPGLNAVEKSSLKFTYQNGKLDAESITLSTDDPVFSANIKRALVSLFQNQALGETGLSSLTYRESDVSGSNCFTKYTLTGSKYVKTRDLNLCSNRDGGTWIAHAVPYQAKNSRAAQSDTTITSCQTCTQDFSSGKLQSVQCSEKHKLDIYNYGGAGAETRVTTMLKLLEQNGKANTLVFQDSTIAKLAFDHSDDSYKANKGTKDSLRKIVDELCKEITGDILGPNVSGLYLDLTKQIGVTPVNDTRSVYFDIHLGRICPGKPQNEKVKSIFQDAAANAGTSPAIEFIAKLYDKMDERVQGIFRMSLAFATRPDKSALESVATLISRGDSNILLAASGLAHQYCLLTNSECGNNAAYNSISDGIAARVGPNCGAVDQPGIEKVIAGLQALGNLDSLSENAVEAISLCLNSTEERVVVQALQAFRRDSCLESLKETARNILKSSDVSTSSNIKIHAYLALTKCLAFEDGELISDILPGASNQVYWFIASHRYNWLQTSNQAKVANFRTRNIFQSIRVPAPTTKPGPGKYSANFDLSLFEKTENIGGSMTANLIYSKESFAPRTISSDLTVDAFGKSYNILEVGVGLADFENIVENVFKNVMERNDAGSESDLPSRRIKRDIPVPNFQQKDVQALQRSTKIDTLHKTNGVTDLYVRIFGTTVCVNSYLLEDVLSKGGQATDTIRDRLQSGIFATNLDFTQGLPLFIDDLAVPTVSGFPLTITLDSTAVVSLKLIGNLNRDSSSLRSKITPSGSVQTRGKMVVGNGGPIQAGIQIEANLHSASDLAIDLNVTPGKSSGLNYDAKISVSQDKTKLVDIRSTLYWISQSANELPVKTPIKSNLPQTVIVDNCCLDLSSALGFKYCADVRIAPLGGGDLPTFPLTGFSVASLTAEKTDPTIKEYVLQLQVNKDDKAGTQVNLVIDTPGSTKNRKIVVSATATGVEESQQTSKGKSLDISIQTPSKKLTGTGTYTKSPNGSGVTTRTATFDIKADAASLLQAKYTGDYADGSKSPLKSSLDIDVKYGQQRQHSLTISTKLDNQSPENLIYLAKVRSSRVPDLNIDLKWDRTFSRDQQKLNFALDQGSDANKNSISLNYLTKFDQNIVNGNIVLKVSLPLEGVDISYNSNTNVDFDAQTASGNWNFDFVNVVQANYKYNYDGMAQLFEVEGSGSYREKKINIKSSGRNAPDADGPKREYALQLNIEPTIFDIDVKVTGRFTELDQGSKLVIQSATTTSLVQAPITTTFEIIRAGNSPRKLSGQLNLGNDRIASSSFEITELSDKVQITLESFIHKLLNDKSEITIGYDGSISGKSDTTIIPLGRRIKLAGSASFSSSRAGHHGHHGGHHRVQVLRADLSVKSDFDKDPKKGFSFSTENTFREASSSFTTGNTVTVNEVPYKVTLDITPGKRFLNEDHSCKLVYQSGESRPRTIGFRFKVESTKEIRSLSAGVKFDLDKWPNSLEEINLFVRVLSQDRSQFYFDSLSRLEFVLKESGTKVILLEASSEPSRKGGRSVRLAVRDDVIFYAGFVTVVAIDSNGIAVEYQRTESGKTKVRVDVAVEKGVSGKFSEVLVNAVYDQHFHSQGPTVKLAAKYKYFFNSLLDFEYIETNSVTIRTDSGELLQNVESSKIYRIAAPSEFLFKSSQSIKGGGRAEEAGFEIGGRLERNKFIALADFVFTKNSNTVHFLKADVLIRPGFPQDSELSISLTLPPVVSYRNIAFKILHDEVSRGQAYKTHLSANLNENKVDVISKIDLGSRTSADIALKLNRDPVRKLFLAYQDSPQGSEVEGSLRWGEDSQVISTSGKVVPVGEGFDLQLGFDSTVLPSKQWEVSISRRVESSKRSTNINLNNAESKKFFKIGVERIDVPANTRKYTLAYDTNMSIPSFAGQKGQLVLDLKAENSGGTAQLDISIGTMTVKASAKKSDSERKLSVSLCPTPDCLTGEIKLIKGNPFQLSALLIKKNIQVGFSVEKTNSGNSFNTISKLYYPQAVGDGGGSDGVDYQQKELALRVFKEDGQNSDVAVSARLIKSAPNSVKKRGVELSAGPRTVSVVVAKGIWDSDTADGEGVDVRIWMNKAREPNKALVLSLINVLPNNGQQGRDLSLVLSHPDFAKEHKIVTSYRYHSAPRDLFSVTTEIDIFKSAGDAIITNINLKQSMVEDSSVFQIGGSLKSQGQGLSWDLLCSNVTVDGSPRTANCKFDGKSATRGDKNFVWNYFSDHSSINAELVDNTGTLFKFKSAPIPKSSGGGSIFDHVTTYQLPGMQESVIREFKAIKNPSGMTYRGYRSSYPADKYTESYIGVYSRNKVGGGVRSSSSEGQTDLLKYSLEEQRPGPEILRIDWNKQSIQKFVDDTNNRNDAVSKGLTDFIRKRGNDNAERVQQIVSRFTNALPDPSGLVARVTDAAQEIAGVSSGASEGLAGFAGRTRRASGDNTRIQAALSSLTESVANTVEGFARLRRAILNRFKVSLDRISQWPSTDQVLSGAKQNIASYAGLVFEKVNSLNRRAEKYDSGIAQTVRDRVRGVVLDLAQDALDESSNCLNDAFPYPEVQQFLNSAPEYFETAVLSPSNVSRQDRADISEKLARAVVKVVSQTFQADFQKGSIVSNLPISKLLIRPLRYSRIDNQKYPTLVDLGVKISKKWSPADAVGLVLGGTHFQSFDGLLKPFGVACQYLLASDMVDNNFTIAVDIQNSYGNPTQSLIITDGIDTVIISGSSSIYVNSRKSGPTAVGAFTIRQSRRWTVVSGNMGITVSCLLSEERQLCEIQASGLYHEKLRGVLGRFNNEAYDDKTLPSGIIAESSENFVKSWRLNQDCRGPRTPLYLQDYDGYVRRLGNPNLNMIKFSQFAQFSAGSSFNDSFNNFILLALILIPFFNRFWN